MSVPRMIGAKEYIIMNCVEKLSALRTVMKWEGVDAYIVLTSDAHGTEYLPEYWQCRAWLSGFTGKLDIVFESLSERKGRTVFPNFA